MQYRHVTLKWKVETLAKQEGKCPICKKDISLLEKKGSPNRAVVDHCHSSGRARYLLCHTCNVGLGLFKDSIELLISAVVYIKLHQKIDDNIPWTSQTYEERELRKAIIKAADTLNVEPKLLKKVLVG